MSQTIIQESIKQGVQWSVSLTLAQDGVTIDLTGYSVRLVIRSNMGVEFDLSSDGGGITLLPGAVEDHITLTLTTVQTSGITWERGCGDIELTNTSGEVEDSWRIDFNNQLKDC